jgi:hypothetical protein
MPYFLTGLGALNCPGDPGCPGYIDPAINAAVLAASGDQAGLDWLASHATPNQATPGETLPTPFSFTAWLNKNSDMVMIGGAAAVGALFLSSSGGLLGGRR